MTKTAKQMDDFFSKVDNIYEAATLKAKRSGRNKANFELRCFWYQPKGQKFTYRSDETESRIKEVDKVQPKSELQALQIQFAKVRNKAKSATIYDNSVKFGQDNILFHFKDGKVLVNKLEWES